MNNWQLWKTDHGMDGMDAKTILVAEFTDEDRGQQYLARRGFTFERFGSYYHYELEKRNTMGAISYKLKKMPIVNVPLNPI